MALEFSVPSPHRRPVPWLLLLATTFLLWRSDVQAAKREVIRALQEDIAGHSYRLRVDLQGTNYLSVPNIVTAEGFRYRGRHFPVLFRQMETVYVDRVSNDGAQAVALTLYRSKKDAGQIRGAIPAAPMGPAAPGAETALGSFARDLSTSVILELLADKNDLAAQRAEILELLGRVFYFKVEPTYEEKEAFILSHRDLPLPKLGELTDLPEEMIRGILERRTGETQPESPKAR